VPAIAPRRPAAAVPSITGLVITPGIKAALVDISASGLLAEAGAPLKVGQAVKITFEGTFEPRSVEARVVRTSVAAMTAAGVRYHVGLAFNVPIALDPPTPEPVRPAVAARETGDDPGSRNLVALSADSPPRADDTGTVAGGSSPVAAARPPAPPRVNRW